LDEGVSEQLRRIFGPVLEEEARRWEKLYNNGGRRIKTVFDVRWGPS
jgi:hypothetical protein